MEWNGAILCNSPLSVASRRYSNLYFDTLYFPEDACCDQFSCACDQTSIKRFENNLSRSESSCMLA